MKRKSVQNKQILDSIYGSGLRIRSRSYRYLRGADNIVGLVPYNEVSDRKSLLSKGGIMYVDILNGEEILSSGLSECSFYDNFDRKIGFTIALGRAYKALNKNTTETN